MRLLISLLSLSTFVAANDWPTWRHDAQRSGATAHALPQEMKLVWSRQLEKPDPAFDYHFRLCADQANEPVAAKGVVFLPSNTNDSVTAYDMQSGAEKWRFITEGTVRFAPVVSGGVVIFGSDDGWLYAVEASSGALKWKTRGAPDDRADYRMLVNSRMCSRWPVRGGAVVQGDTAFFGCGIWPSEGVWLVAVDVATGKVKWRSSEIAQIDDGLEEHGRMADMGLPPHGYLAMLAGKVAMPSGRALAAFVDSATGHLDPYNSYYAKVYPVPRGSWAVCGNTDFWFQGGAVMGTNASALEKLPTGPLSVEDFARLAGKDVAWANEQIRKKVVKMKDGKVMLDPHDPTVTMTIFGNRDYTKGQLFQMAERPVLNMQQIGTRHEVGERGMPVFTKKLMFRSEFADPKGIEVERGMTRVAPPTYDVLRAYKLDEASWTLAMGGAKKSDAPRRNLEFPIAWELKVSALTVKLLAGDCLYLAGENKVVAVDVREPKIVWQQAVKGYPVGMIAANDHLVVSTDAGALYCFGASKDEPKTLAAEKPAEWEREPHWRGQVAKLKANLGGGYGFVLGWNSGALAKELALQTTLRVIVAEPDAAIAAKAREALSKEGVWARRMHVVTGTSEILKLPPYFAEVVFCENLMALDNGARVWTRIALDALRPYSGVAVLPLRPKLVEQAKAFTEAMGGFEFSTEKNITTIRRSDAPKGADDWTHEAASAANTFASGDKLAVPPFGLLWYSGGIDREFSPAFEFHHNRNPYPTIVQGRMFMLAANELHAVDAYTGRHLWKATVPESPKSERRLADHRQFSRPTDQNLIAAKDRVYVLRESDAQVFDAAKGTALTAMTVPNDESVWDEARLEGDTMFVAIGKRLVALDRVSGAMKWAHVSEQGHVAFGLGDGHVFTIGYSTARGQSQAKIGAEKNELIVLKASTGEKLWSEPLDAQARKDQTDASAGKPSWNGIFQDNPLKPTLHYNAAHGVVLAIMDRHDFHAFNAQSGSALWHYDSGSRLTDLVGFEPPTITSDKAVLDDGTLLDITTGKPDEQAVGGRGTGCNRFIGSDALITFRSALACVMNLDSKERTYLTSTRPGCTNSMIPAAGLLNAPNYAHGCVCNYPFLTSFALYHLPEAAKWAPKEKPDVKFQKNPNAN